ncbi:MAG: FAD-dependent oxidoreductase [Methylococcales bacterium]|nr:FAD-dependent oxidoreductase [Methylococcales bacterium]
MRPFLIVGQGLAGSLLAYQLLKRGCDVQVVDPEQGNASQVAAGLINPVTGKYLTLGDKTPHYLAKARHTYAQLSALLGADLCRPLPFIRLLPDEASYQKAVKRQKNPSYQPYLSDLQRYPHAGNFIGQIEQIGAAQLNTRAFLKRFRHHLQTKGCYAQQTLAYEDITLSPLTWRGQPFQAIIFCEGHRVRNNPWFGYLPLHPAKGEILTLKLTLADAALRHFGHWLLPEGSERTRLGATFMPRSLDLNPSSAARQQLLTSLSRVNEHWANAPVLEQQAQIRPGSHDRQPYLGAHPQHPRLWLFNGLGAKGSLQAPLLSEQMADALLQGEPIPSVVALSRCDRVNRP